MGVITRANAKKTLQLHHAAVAFALQGAIDKDTRRKDENFARAAVSYWHHKAKDKYSFGGNLPSLGPDEFDENLHQLRFISHELDTMPVSPASQDTGAVDCRLGLGSTKSTFE
jgi:hypothetical protein